MRTFPKIANHVGRTSVSVSPNGATESIGASTTPGLYTPSPTLADPPAIRSCYGGRRGSTAEDWSRHPLATAGDPKSPQTSLEQVTRNSSRKSTRASFASASGFAGIEEADNQLESGELKGYMAFVKVELGSLQSDMVRLKRDIAELRLDQREAEKREAARAVFEADTVKQFTEAREALALVGEEQKVVVARLSGDIASLQFQGDANLHLGLDHLNAQMQKQLFTLEASLAQHKVEAVEANQALDAAVESKFQLIRGSIADNTREEHMREIQSMKAFDDLFKGLESRVEWEMARISNEHHDLRKMHIQYFQDAVDSLGTSLRKDFNELTAYVGPKMESCSTIVNSSLDDFTKLLQAELKLQSDERLKLHTELQNSVEETINTLSQQVGVSDAKFASEVQRMSDARRQDNIDLQRHMHNCVQLILPAMTAERLNDKFPREKIQYPSAWVT